MSCQYIPSEILLQIFQYLVDSPVDLYHSALSCKTWSYCALQLLWHKPMISNARVWEKIAQTLVQEHTVSYLPYSSIVRRINVSSVSKQIDNQSLAILSVCKQLDRVTLSGCSNITNSGLMDFLSKGTGNYLLSIDLSDIKCITDETITLIAATCRRLQGLNLSVTSVKEGECMGITDKSIVSLASSCRELRRIRLSNWSKLTDISIKALAEHCPGLLELDAVNCPITNQSLLTLFQQCRDLRELKVSHCHYLNDMAFTASALATTMTPKNTYYFDQMRALDLTGVSVTDRSVDVFTSAAPKIRNLILNKCINITDIGVGYITRLGKYLHYLHLGSCRQITDQSIENLTNKCTRIRYIDLASCSELQDSTVAALATLPKLKRIGLVKCDKITNNAILALTKQPRTSMTLERIHLSYCTRLTAPAISQLVIHCRRLTHLSLSYISAFQYKEFQRFCREPPEELTEDQRRTFCVFSGKNVDKLRAYFRSPEFLEDEHRRRLTLHTARHALTTRLDEITDNLYGVRITN